jgi:hypothetical protein
LPIRGDEIMKKKYVITYAQTVLGKIETDSYSRTLEEGEDIQMIIDALHEDPHVIWVDVEEVENK